MGKANKAKNNKETLKIDWSDLIEYRQSVLEKYERSVTTVLGIIGSFKTKEEEINKNKQEELKELDTILSGFIKSIGDIQTDLDMITKEHAEVVINKEKDENGNEIEVTDFNYRKGIIAEDDVASFIKYNQLTQAYLGLENMAVELYSKVIPDIFLRAGNILGDESFVNEVVKVKEEIEQFTKYMKENVGDPSEFLSKDFLEIVKNGPKENEESDMTGIKAE